MILSFDNAVQRINKIIWNIKNNPKESHSVLLGEYLRRMACFFKPYFSSQSPMGSPLGVIKIENNSFFLEIEKIVEESLPDIINPIHYKICKNYLELAYLVEKGYPEALEVQDIYEPIIQFFERGGKLRFDSDRSFSCGSAAFVLDNWIDFHSNRPETDISFPNLEKMDINNS
ncbi:MULTISPECIES: hypothetical protein [unclassified Brevibacillus]|uniref:hypothetical protein n=1 Tax=unclassified Brevibacillus TaxID=2684853 RepID=UPI0035651363